jgi:hypothetical protein
MGRNNAKSKNVNTLTVLDVCENLKKIVKTSSQQLDIPPSDIYEELYYHLPWGWVRCLRDQLKLQVKRELMNEDSGVSGGGVVVRGSVGGSKKKPTKKQIQKKNKNRRRKKSYSSGSSITESSAFSSADSDVSFSSMSSI